LKRIAQKIIFRLRVETQFLSRFRSFWWRLQGMKIGKGSTISSMNVTWPHQLAIGEQCIFEDGIFFKYSSYWKPGPSMIIGKHVFIGRGCEFNITARIEVGDETMISSGCKFIDHDHGVELSDQRIGALPHQEAAITLEEDVWLGVNVVVLKGVTIGHGAVVGAGAVVTRSIPACEIWAGVPARKIGNRIKKEL
jgi:acetyltransferase-like isoleucine patch superfamily enzyme